MAFIDSAMHVIHLDDADNGISFTWPGSTLRLSGERLSVPFASDLSAAEFIESIRGHVER